MEQFLLQLATLAEACNGQQVIGAKRLQTPLLELHSAAAGMGGAVTAPIEALLVATTARSLIAGREIDELVVTLQAAVAATAATAAVA